MPPAPAVPDGVVRRRTRSSRRAAGSAGSRPRRPRGSTRRRAPRSLRRAAFIVSLRTLPHSDGRMSERRHPDMPEPDRPLDEQPAAALTGGDWSAGVDLERRGDIRIAISNAMVGLKKRFYGKGPERARTYLNDDYVFCALEGGLTRNEQTLVEAGEEEAVRQYRLLFQKTVTH